MQPACKKVVAKTSISNLIGIMPLKTHDFYLGLQSISTTNLLVGHIIPMTLVQNLIATFCMVIKSRKCHFRFTVSKVPHNKMISPRVVL